MKFGRSAISHTGILVVTLLAYLVCSVAVAEEPSSKDSGMQLFSRQIAPVISAKCVSCHRPDNLKGGLDLSTLAGMVKGGEGGSALKPGSTDESPLYQRVVSHNGKPPEMPAKGEPLTQAEAKLLSAWIMAGAAWPEKFVIREMAKADANFWSFQPIADVIPPAASGAADSWQINPIDRFILAKLNEHRLVPNPPAPAEVFLRRATYDLTGLPPSPEEIQNFQKDVAENGMDAAVVKLIDRLLDSPRYGEAWGRHWLDVIRFGESRGYERNEIITNLWPFRDYVINRLNADVPFDQFVREHLAGDIIGKDQPDIEIGSAFLVAGPYDDVGNQDANAAAQIRADQMDEMIRATAEAFLGLTMGCARCHDHKFDPLTTKDYYSLYATFSGTVHGPRDVATAAAREERAARIKPLQDERDRIMTQKSQASPDDKELLAELETKLKKIDQQIAQTAPLPVWWVGSHRPSNGPFAVFIGGNPQKKGDEVTPASLSALDGLSSRFRLESSSDEGQRRLALADWLTAKDNPLVPRVLANRIWHYHFGTGIVNTPSDFGYMGGRPSHPELLDWLTRELVRGGWRLKPLHRLVMTSQVYRQSSAWNPERARIDGDSRLLWRFPPRRLSAEEVRDTMLSIAGKLNLNMGGPGFRLYEYQQDNVATYVPLDDVGPETYRRAVYHHNARAMRVDLLTDFDCPDPAFAEPRRASTISPLQALTLMNHRFSLKMAQALSERLESESPAVEERIRRAFMLAYARQPSQMELEAGVKLVTQHGLVWLCRAILNSNELIQLD